MVDLSIRLVLAGAAALVAGLLDKPPYSLTLQVGALVASYGVLAFLLERRKMMNSGVAGLIAILDAAAISTLVGASGHLDRIGFLALLPCAYAAAKYGSLPTAMAPLAASTMIGAHIAFQKGEPGPWLYTQAIGVLAVGLVMNHRRIVVTVTRDVVGPVEPLSQIEPDGYLQLRESFRRLKEMYQEIERKSRKDRLTARLLETRFPTGVTFPNRLAAVVQDLLDAESVAIYTVAQFENTLIVRGTAGEVGSAMQDAAIPIPRGVGPSVLGSTLDEALLALVPDPGRGAIFQVVLMDQSQVSGMMCIRPRNPGDLDECRGAANEISGLVTKLLREETDRDRRERRLRETELLYDAAIVTQGAETPNTLAERMVRELSETMEFDHLGVYWLDGQESLPGSTRGVRMKVIESMSFAFGPGLQGWLRIGAPELVVFRTNDDDRCDQLEMLKRRIGSFVLIPIQYDEKPSGYLLAATHRAGGIDVREADTLRLVAAELSRALSELEGEQHGGLTTPLEFHELTKQGGILVYLEPTKREAMIETFGRPALDQALRVYARRIRGRLPAGGAVCRRHQGDLVALLRGVSREFATSWANEAAASAALVGVRAGEGRGAAPLAIRAKVAVIEENAVA